MAFIPALKAGWWNGWLYLVAFFACYGLFLRSCSQAVVDKLYSTAGWEKKHSRWAAMRKPLALAGFVVLIFSPLKFGTPVFWAGTFLTLAGFTIMFTALFTFRKTPAEDPVRNGIYRYSRNPQFVGLTLVMLGPCISCGNGLALLLMILVIVLYHFRILGEESACLKEYGQPFQGYMNRVPRYFGFRKRGTDEKRF